MWRESSQKVKFSDKVIQSVSFLRSRGTGSADQYALGKKKYAHEVRRLIPKMREIFTNRLRNVSASIMARSKRCLVNYTVLQRIVLLC